MKTHPFPILAISATLALGLGSARADEAPDPSWRKAADNHVYAQKLANEVMAGSDHVVNIGIHATKPGSADERMVASNLDRIGKIDDDDDKAASMEGKTVLHPHPKEGQIEVLIPMEDSGGTIIGAIALVFPYRKGEDLKAHEKSIQIRNRMAKKIKSLEQLYEPAS